MAFDLGALGQAYQAKLGAGNIDLDPLYKLADFMMKKYELEKLVDCDSGLRLIIFNSRGCRSDWVLDFRVGSLFCRHTRM